MKPTLILQVKRTTEKLSREWTMENITRLLEKCGIAVRGNVRNTSKRKLLLESLRGINEAIITDFIDKASRELSMKAARIPGKTIYLHLGFRGTKVEKFIVTGDYEEAVRVAFLRINNRVKLQTGLVQDGAALMRTVFTPNKPLIRINALATQGDKDEQEGIMHILEGAMLAFRNPQSHDDEKKLSFEEASQILQLANYLMGLLDAST